MNCPACGETLHQYQAETLAVEVCAGGCGGVWFDRRELQQADEPHEPDAGLLALQLTAVRAADPAQRRHCPKCEDVVMMRHYYSIKHQVEVDQCPNCAGFWLDFGELARIREEFPNDAARRQAVEEYFCQAFQPMLSEMRAGSQAGEHAVRQIARFLCTRIR